MRTLRELIEAEAIFSSLAEDQKEGVMATARRREFKRGDFLTFSGERWPYLFMVAGGSLNAVKESLEGRRLIVLTFTPGQLFWGLTFFDDRHAMPVALEATEDSVVYLWDKEALLPALTESGEAMWALCQLMVARMVQASDIVEGLAFQPVAARLAKLIVGRFGGSGTQPVARDLTLDEMAAMIGTSREHVCRLLYRFANEDLIEITRTEFVIKDTDKLQGLIEGG